MNKKIREQETKHYKNNRQRNEKTKKNRTLMTRQKTKSQIDMEKKNDEDSERRTVIAPGETKGHE